MVCSDWPGPQRWQKEGGGPIPKEFYFAADDLSHEANIWGMVAFIWCCYSGGTPLLDNYYQQAFEEPKPIARRPFVAHLPKRLLGHEQGGALAVVARVERAWGTSFLEPGMEMGSKANLSTFIDTFRRLLWGYPVGLAVETFNRRYTEIATEWAMLMQAHAVGQSSDPYEMAGLATMATDARNYVVIGDPAVRLLANLNDESGVFQNQRPVLPAESYPEGWYQPLPLAQAVPINDIDGPDSAEAVF